MLCFRPPFGFRRGSVSCGPCAGRTFLVAVVLQVPVDFLQLLLLVNGLPECACRSGRLQLGLRRPLLCFLRLQE
eukprot:3898552-Heterocapsa_arctica.AAC.1